jgi:hypothetical protein
MVWVPETLDTSRDLLIFESFHWCACRQGARWWLRSTGRTAKPAAGGASLTRSMPRPRPER